MDRLRRPRSRSPLDGYKRKTPHLLVGDNAEESYLMNFNAASAGFGRPRDTDERRPYNGDYFNQPKPADAKSNVESRLDQLEKAVASLSSRQSKAGFVVSPEHDMRGITTSMWLDSIDDEAALNGWRDAQTVDFMRSKMTGLLLDWFETLPKIYSWREYKLTIGRNFPDHVDYAKTLKLLVNRVKDSLETFENYYYTKLYLLECCKITGKDAVSCIIDGLCDEGMEHEARSFFCATPQELFDQFLSNLKNRETSFQSERPKEPRDEPKWGRNYETDNAPTKKKVKTTCFICKEKGHLSYECKYKSANRITTASGNDPSVINCAINGRPYEALFDTGSAVNIARRRVADELKLTVKASRELIVGYGGKLIPAVGETTVDLTVNGVKLTIPVLIVDDSVQDIPLIVGQPVLSSGHLSVSCDNGGIKFSKRTR